ncbi:ABC-type nitrate/sulfonate/bicarbonate transport system ATPase subunit/ABC-type nitrate/sulfonate/bicarbonate transport system permease component [Bradyrhizobium sp. GM2.4]
MITPTAVALEDAKVAFQLGDGRVYTAVEKAHLTVAQGEFVAIVGPTGCGKSTLLNVAAGLLKPAAGSVRIFDQPLAGLNRDAGYLFQADALFPWKTALDNVAIGLEVSGTPRSEALPRAQKWLTSVGLGAFANRYPHMLSGGQRKRVALAQVLIRDPKILLMDEPFGPLDAQTRQVMGNLLLDLWNADRKAVLFVTHDLEEAIALADRVVIMSAGPSSRIIGDWRVSLPRPRDIFEVRLDTGIPCASSRDLERAQGRGHEGLCAVHASGGGGLMSRVTLLTLQVLVAVVCLALWQLLSTVPVFGKILLPPFFFSNPVDVFAQIVKWFSSGVIWKHLGITLTESILAFVIGSAGGVLIGFWFARQPLVAAVFDPYVKMVNALPRVVLAPIFALWLGLGIWSKVALGVTLVFFIVFFNVYQGVKEVSRTVLDNGRMLGMSERQLMQHVYWPSALSWMFSSLHTSVGFAVVGAVVGEYLGSAAGLGYLIQQAEGIFDVAGVFAGMFVLSAFVILIDFGVTLVERRLLVWRPTVDGRG